MNPETLASLQSLEQELDRLRSAIDHIEQAKSVAQKVVGAVAGVQKKYGEHLDALLALQQQGLEQLHSASTIHFEEWNTSAKRHILESAARARKQLEEHDADARAAGCTLKLVCRGFLEHGKARGRVAPERIPLDHLYATVRGTSSVLSITTDLMGTLTIVEEDPQILQTAYGVFSDLVRIVTAEGGRYQSE